MIYRILSLLLLAAAVPTSAPTVRGRVTDAATQQPVAGAFVVLLDATGDGVRADISGPGGEFTHTAPAPGPYRLRVERIGVQTVTSEAFDLAAGAVLEVPMRVATRPVLLAPVASDAGARCTVRPSGGAALEQAWEEARKALSLAAWTQEQGGVPFTTMTYERTRALGSLAVRHEERRMRSGFDRTTFTSASARELATGTCGRSATAATPTTGWMPPTCFPTTFWTRTAFACAPARWTTRNCWGWSSSPSAGTPRPTFAACCGWTGPPASCGTWSSSTRATCAASRCR
jgi:hypothetical protein